MWLGLVCAIVCVALGRIANDGAATATAGARWNGTAWLDRHAQWEWRRDGEVMLNSVATVAGWSRVQAVAQARVRHVRRFGGAERVIDGEVKA